MGVGKKKKASFLIVLVQYTIFFFFLGKRKGEAGRMKRDILLLFGVISVCFSCHETNYGVVGMQVVVVVGGGDLDNKT